MPCFKPLTAYYSKYINVSGKRSMVFSKHESLTGIPISLPCGQCIGCRLEYSRQWAMRCLHEEMSWKTNSSFITLTYDNDHLPSKFLVGNSLSGEPLYGGVLVKKHFQDFMKRLRKKFSDVKIRFYHCGEYGSKFSRPHYHAIIFNFDFPDKEIFRESEGRQLFISKDLSSLWPFGFSTIGNVTFDSIAYVARYVTKKINGSLSENHYKRLVVDENGVLLDEIHLPKEYSTMSNRPGIGLEYYKRYKSEIYPSDFIILQNGRRMRPPKYYDLKFEIEDPVSFSKIKHKRLLKAKLLEKDNSFFRLNQKHKVAQAAFSQSSRTYENA